MVLLVLLARAAYGGQSPVNIVAMVTVRLANFANGSNCVIGVNCHLNSC